MSVRLLLERKTSGAEGRRAGRSWRRAAGATPTWWRTAWRPSGEIQAGSMSVSEVEIVRGLRGGRAARHLRHVAVRGRQDACSSGDRRPRRSEARMLTMRDIRKVYRTDLIETHALSDFSLHVRTGEFVAVMGPVRLGQDHVPERGRAARHVRRRHLPARRPGREPALRRRDVAHPQPEDRLRLPELQPDPGPGRVRQRGRAAALPRPARRRAQGPHRAARWSRSASPRARGTCPRSSPAASSSAWPSRACWPATRA